MCFSFYYTYIQISRKNYKNYQKIFPKKSLKSQLKILQKIRIFWENLV